MFDLKKPASINMNNDKKPESVDLYDVDTQIASKIAVNIEAVRTECNETVDAFIFSYIMPYVDSIAEIKITKQELIEAVQLIRKQKEANEKYGVYDLTRDNIVAAEVLAELNSAYDRGFVDGHTKAMESAVNYISGKEKMDVKEENQETE